ncbi:tyrosine-type recombinase/integrase [Halomarina pelagica]|uniref:tyrosine-type recombinase/integrase n=1 Tax=Halomarina pelagica TaxID=2961599 RepID=UPI0020C4C08D|nr:site-specific integrase [Halomarina sp. BND7]
MQLKDYDERDGKRVWLTTDEVDLLLEQTKTTEQRIALGLGARSGLRVSEIVDVTPTDVVNTSAGLRVRVWEGKGSKYRESPIPRDLHATIAAYGDVRDAGPDTPLVDKSTRTVERWVQLAAERCQAETADAGWQFLGPHDLRRTWGTLLVEAGVEPGMTMEWGGWEDWKTFREHYLGVYSPEMQRQEVAKVEWL